MKPETFPLPFHQKSPLKDHFKFYFCIFNFHCTSMNVRYEISLKPYNTFGVECTADELIELHSPDETKEYFDGRDPGLKKILLLGGGSNILFTGDFHGTVIKYSSKDYNIIQEDDNHVWIKGGAGIPWHDLVLRTINSGYQGLENLSLIPGLLGAAPIQNIGAYGVEIKDFLESVEIHDLSTGQIRTVSNPECEFEYRDSIFKRELKNKVIILSVTLKLNKHPEYNITYKDIENKIHEKGLKNLNAKVISELVVEIRKSKLPDPAVTGNAGSFFKNPVLNGDEINQLRTFYPDVPHFEYKNHLFKVPAAWMIEKCGWKGYRKGNVGVHKNQPLVLLNLGNASGKEIFRLSDEIRSSVKNKFGIFLEPEINIV